MDDHYSDPRIRIAYVRVPSADVLEVITETLHSIDGVLDPFNVVKEPAVEEVDAVVATGGCSVHLGALVGVSGRLHYSH